MTVPTASADAVGDETAPDVCPDCELRWCVCFGDDEDTCWNCSGEGFVSSCFEEWACVDPESGCNLCTRLCDVCQPNKPATDTASHLLSQTTQDDDHG